MVRCVIGALLASLWSACRTSHEAAFAREDTVVILPREVENLDPRYVGDAYGLKLSRLLYASLVTIDPRSLAPKLDLAESVDAEGPTRFRVRVKPALHFADGSALDAADVVATFRAITDAKVQSRYRSSYAFIAEVHAEDAHTVLFTLREPHATFLTDLELPVLRSEDAFAPRARDRLPVSSGPFVLAARNRSGLLLRRNPAYAGGGEAPDTLRFVVMRDDNVRALRMLASAGDLAQNVIPPLLLPLFEQRDDLRVLSARGAGTTYLGLNLEHPALADRRVREALAHAIDRAALVRYKLRGHALLASSWIPPGHWAHAADTPTYAYDPERARALLREAGYGPEHPLALVLRSSSDRNVISMSRAIAGMLSEVGAALEVRPSESATLLSELARGRFELTLLQVPEVFEPNVLSWFFESDRIPKPGVREGGNRFRFRSAELDRALEAGRATLDLEARKQIYRKVQHLLARELPVIPLWHEDVIAVVSRRLWDYEVPRDARFATLADSD